VKRHGGSWQDDEDIGMDRLAVKSNFWVMLGCYLSLRARFGLIELKARLLQKGQGHHALEPIKCCVLKAPREHIIAVSCLSRSY